MTYARITGTGGYLPAKVLTNKDLEATVQTSDEWIVARTGIRQRHIAADDEFTSDLALHACRRALDAAGRTAADVDLIIVATSTPDMVFPSSACLLQAKLRVKKGAAFDVQAVCSGFVYALSTADLYIKSGAHRCALVVGAEVFRASSIGKTAAPACSSATAPGPWCSRRRPSRGSSPATCMPTAGTPASSTRPATYAAARSR